MVKGDYVVLVHIHSYSNPGSLLANGTCCDFDLTRDDGSCAVAGCDIYFQYCLLNATLKLGRCSQPGYVIFNAEPLLNISEFAGIANPYPIRGLTQAWSVSWIML